MQVLFGGCGIAAFVCAWFMLSEAQTDGAKVVGFGVLALAVVFMFVSFVCAEERGRRRF